MDGIQKTVCEGLNYLANCVKDDRYGKDDDFDRDSFLDDLQDQVVGVTE